MVNVTVVNDNGEVVSQEVVSRNASLQNVDGESFAPSVVQRIKFDNKGQMSSITSECGETENRRQGNDKAKLTVEGIITEGEIEAMRSLKNQEEISLNTDVFQGNVIVERLSITQESGLLYISLTGEEKSLAFNFQLQLKEP
jgi:hypothetical protein